LQEHGKTVSSIGFITGLTEMIITPRKQQKNNKQLLVLPIFIPKAKMQEVISKLEVPWICNLEA